MSHSSMNHSVALLTPTYRNDIERFALLCDSIDQHVSGHERHYGVVIDQDIPLFSHFNSARRSILPASQFLPRWLRLLPAFRMRHGRRIWWSMRGGAVHGWHIQQVLKCAAASELPEQRYCIIDSDNVFFRPFDVSAYAGCERAPLYAEPAAIAADAPMHALWTRNGERLLGLSAVSFPADDYIGQDIVWDKDAVQAMLKTIEKATGRDWVEALCRTRAFSEYLLYGMFVRATPALFAAHALTEESIACAYWDDAALDAKSVEALIAAAPAKQAALSIASFSKTPISVIREAAGLSALTDHAGPRGLRAA